jgi:hypothetical protein
MRMERPKVTVALRIVTPIRGSILVSPIFSIIGVAPHKRAVAVNRRITTLITPPELIQTP